ncbi:MAG: ribonuclease protein component, ribonuclease protein component [Parcubacteria group bacterium]|nr:ribonuclease protein component, ribonuclease protein component [Parcubacteria group bacterium]
MLNKKNKANKSLFKAIIKKGSSYFSQNISLKIIKTDDAGHKFGVAVSKKELKTAVKRNLLKRRTSSILQKIEPKISAGFSCVVFLKKGALDIPYQKLQDEMVFLLKKANRL